MTGEVTGLSPTVTYNSHRTHPDPEEVTAMISLEPPSRLVQRRRRIPRVAWLATALSLLLAAGCGSSGPSGGTSRSAASPVTAAYAYSHCMRAHGVSSFPDPHVSTSPGHVAISQQAAPVSSAQAPVFKSAQHACQGILKAVAAAPAGHGPGRAVLLAFARCLRGHGLSNFPDPNGQGHLSLQMVSAAGVDLKAPAFLSAAMSCVGVTHGEITVAEIHALISGRH